MATTYTPNVLAAKPATGEDNGTWGDLVNGSTFDIFDQAIDGVTNVSMPDANFSLTAIEGAIDQGRSPQFVLTGTLTADRTLTFPTEYSVNKQFSIKNNTNFTITVAATGSTGTVILPPGSSKSLWINAGNVLANENTFGNIRAVAVFQGVGSITTLNQFNISAITRVSSGVYTVTFLNTFPSANYAVICMSQSSGGVNLIVCTDASFTQSTTQFQVIVKNNSGTVTDSNYVSLLVIA